MNPAMVNEFKKFPGRLREIMKGSGFKGFLALPDYLLLRLRTGLEFNEYFDYEFEKQDKNFRDSYLNTKQKIKYFNYLNSQDKYYIIARNKYLTHLLLKELEIPATQLLYFYNPGFGTEGERFGGRKERVRDFMIKTRPEDFVVKPAEGTWGIGVTVLKKTIPDGENIILQKWDDQLVDLYSLLGKDPLIFEKRIHQTRQMHVINPSSLNSIRIDTALYPDGTVKIFKAFALFGRSSKCISNCGESDNVTADVDLNTGMMKTVVHFKGYRNIVPVTHHPDSGLQIDGARIEQWDYIKSQVIEFHQKIPFIKVIGWDVVMTEKGVVVIEMNDFIDNTGQFLTGKGWRKDVEECYQAWRSNEKEIKGILEKR